MAYRAPVADMLFALKHAAGLDEARSDGLYGDVGDDLLNDAGYRLPRLGRIDPR